jgi:hypothetical protein
MGRYCITCKETTNTNNICPKYHREKFKVTKTSLRLRKIYLYVKDHVDQKLKDEVEILSLDALRSDQTKFEADLRHLIESHTIIENIKKHG